MRMPPLPRSHTMQHYTTLLTLQNTSNVIIFEALFSSVTTGGTQATVYVVRSTRMQPAMIMPFSSGPVDASNLHRQAQRHKLKCSSDVNSCTHCTHCILAQHIDHMTKGRAESCMISHDILHWRIHTVLLHSPDQLHCGMCHQT